MRYFADRGISPWQLDQMSWAEFNDITEGALDEQWKDR